jgi:hypothetical protein
MKKRARRVLWYPTQAPRHAGAGGMTKFRAVTFVRSRQIGWTERNAGPDRSDSVRTCGSLNSAEKIGDGGHDDLLFLKGELGKDGQRQNFGCGALTLRKGPGWVSQPAEGGLLMQRQGVVNL